MKNIQRKEEKEMAVKDRGKWVIVLFILSGLVIGGLIGNLTGNIDRLWWLSYGQEFGLQDPLVLDLSVLKLTFGMTIKINIASIIGVVVALLIYRKV